MALGEDVAPDRAGAPLSTGAFREPRAWAGLVIAWVSAQAAVNASRWRLWVPVALGLGAAIYLALPAEPDRLLILGIAVTAMAASLAARRWLAPSLAAAVLLAALVPVGMAVAKLRTDAVSAPIVAEGTGARRIDGWVVDVASPGSGGARILVAPVRISGLAPSETPKRIRLTLGEGTPPGPGAAISLRAVLHPPPAPASPGAYDFARNAFFDGVGGSGFTLDDPRQAVLPRPPWRLRAAMGLNAARWSLARRIAERIGPAAGGIAAAMATGQEAFVPAEQTAALRDAGLAHIVSISGLHMAIVGGFVFGVVRFGLALWPWAAQAVSTKKVAAVAGLIAVGAYLALSGAPPPAERAAVTASVAFLAILVDRRAISLHALAVAATVVLLMQPEAVAEPGFQMSFAATAALIALAEAWPRPVREISAPWPIRAVQAAGGWVAVSIGASLVAGLATGPFAIQHFNRVAVFGLFANLATAPLASFVMMPALALGAALEPVGLGAPFLHVAGWSIEAMLWVAGLAARAPGAVQVVPSAPALALPAAFVGILWLCLMRGQARLAGIPLALAVSLWPRPAPPDLWIAADGSAAAVRMDKTAILLRPDARRFAADLWMRRRGLTESPAGHGAYACTRRACAPTSPTLPLALDWGRRAPPPQDVEGLCASAPVIVVRANIAVPPNCAGRLVIDGAALARGGSAELWRTPQGWRIAWAQSVRGDRPWSRSPAA